MQEKTSIAQRYLSLHRKWRRLRKQQLGGPPSWELVSLDSAVKALAWVLGADPYDGAGQPYGAADMAVDGKPPLRGVRLTGVWQEAQRFRGRPDGHRYWLLEIPASQTAQTEYWAVFLTEEQVSDLGVLFAAALLGSGPEALRQLAGAADHADASSVSDIRSFIQQAEWSVAERQTGRETGGAA